MFEKPLSTLLASAALAVATAGLVPTLRPAPGRAGRWLGSVFYEGAPGMPDPTIVNVTK